MKKEMVNHPSHYINEDGRECIDVMLEKYGEFPVLCFCVLNAFKYDFRKGRKDNNSISQEERKAAWYRNYAGILYESMHGITKFIAGRIIKK